ncbi:hypothetical protein [Haloarchaeobius sp. DFWS5]|uniref:hypothetical protein n=1 Tax=Haloarchaeobius sp. DFWS5 TaxID=3446114 RepID=UPI003EBAC48B
MAASRPPFQLSLASHPVERVGWLAERGGAALALVAGLVAVGTGAIAVAGSTGPLTPAATVDRLVTAAVASPTTLSGAALVFHWAVVLVAVGCWFLGLGFILTGYLD